MTCQSPTDAGAAERLQLAALARLLDNQDQPSGPSKNTVTQPSNGALNGMIASRCKRMTFRSNECRKRYLSKHQILANPPSSDI